MQSDQLSAALDLMMRLVGYELIRAVIWGVVFYLMLMVFDRTAKG